MDSMVIKAVYPMSCIVVNWKSLCLEIRGSSWIIINTFKGSSWLTFVNQGTLSFKSYPPLHGNYEFIWIIPSPKSDTFELSVIYCLEWKLNYVIETHFTAQ